MGRNNSLLFSHLSSITDPLASRFTLHQGYGKSTITIGRWPSRARRQRRKGQEEGEAQVRASATTNHQNRTEKAQASRTKCRGEATYNLSYRSMQTTVSEDAESP